MNSAPYPQAPERPSADQVLYRFDKNVVAAAGAGTGKTYRLAGVYLHLVLGLSHLVMSWGTLESRRVAAHRILATTFTRDAAAEMRARVEGRLRFLAGLSEADPAALRAHKEHGSWLGELLDSALFADEYAGRGQQAELMALQSFRTLAQKSLTELPRATISTLHSFASDILRTYPVEARLAPGFTVLEASDAREMLDRAVNHELALRLSDTNQRQRLLSLFRLLGGRAEMVSTIQRMLSTMAEEGVEPGATQLRPVQTQASAMLLELVRLLSSIVQVAPNELWKKPNAKNLLAYDEAKQVVSRLQTRLTELQPIFEQCQKAGALASKEQSAEVEQAIELLNKERWQLGDLGEQIAAGYKIFSRVESIYVKEARQQAYLVINAKDGKLLDEIRELGRRLLPLTIADPLGLYLQSIVGNIAKQIKEEKRRLAVLDFSDMMLAARDLLRDHPEVQREVGANFDAVLVDEFQDTNRVQRDLVYLLHQSEAFSSKRKPGQSVDPRTLRAKGLLVVGDRKQSIYGFRGADIAVFQNVCVELCGAEAAAELSIQSPSQEPPANTNSWERLRDGDPIAALVTLDTNRRSEPALLAAFNAIAQADMRFDETDALMALLPPAERLTFASLEQLKAPKEKPVERPLLHLIRTSTSQAAQELKRSLGGDQGKSQLGHAAVVARLIRSLTEEQTGLEVMDAVGEDDVPANPRKVTFPRYKRSDITVLVRSYSAARSLAALLDELAIPFVYAGKEGLLTTLEVQDLAALARLLVDPNDNIALVNVLRGPMVAVADSTLLVLARASRRRKAQLPHPARLAVPLEQWLEAELLALIPEHEKKRLERFGTVYAQAYRHQNRLGAPATLSLVLESIGFEETLAALPRADQRIANVRAMLREMEVHALDFRALVQAVEDAETSGDGAHSPIVVEEDDDAVRITTIHASKGLEYPVVILMQAGAPLPNISEKLVCARSATGLEFGLSLGPGSGGKQLAELSKARDWAERQRLSYVALTRAKKELFLTGLSAEAKKPNKQALSASLERCIPALVQAGLADDWVVDGQLPPVREVTLHFPEQVSSDEERLLDEEQALVQGPKALGAETVLAETVLVTTSLADFAVCERRYELMHLVGLDEHLHAREEAFAPVIEEPVAWEPEAKEEPEPARFTVRLDARGRGSLLHTLLESFGKTVWSDPQAAQQSLALGLTGRQFIEAQLDSQGIVDSAVREAVTERACRWLEGTLAKGFTEQVAEGRLKVLVEHEFLVPLGPNGPFLKGTMDLVLLRLDEQAKRVESVWVIDYKSGQSEGISEQEPGHGTYAVQVAAYRYAAQKLWPEAQSVQAGLAFLGGGMINELPQAQPEVDLGTLSRRLIAARAKGRFEPLREASTCKGHRCGYVGLCHPSYFGH